jgi:pimeloyl-ACP methyl ester carboxylesterase
MNALTLSAGTVDYQEWGPPGGRPLVFVHGYTMDSSLWAPLAEQLAGRGLRCIAPTWPLGAHLRSMNPGAELTIEGIAAMVDELIGALELEDTVLVGNDTGGAVAQVVATSTPERLGGLVLTSCDAFEHFPPPILKPLIVASRSATAFRAALQPLRTRAGRRIAYGALPMAARWVEPALANGGVREDLRRLTGSLERRTTVEAASRLPGFAKPALVAWSADDAFFPLEDGRRLAATLPDASLEVIERARTFSMVDRTDRLAELLGAFAKARVSVS